MKNELTTEELIIQNIWIISKYLRHYKNTTNEHFVMKTFFDYIECTWKLNYEDWLLKIKDLITYLKNKNFLGYGEELIL